MVSKDQKFSFPYLNMNEWSRVGRIGSCWKQNNILKPNALFQSQFLLEVF